MPTLRLLLRWTAVLLVAGTGCHRAPQPSPVYANAHAQYVELLSEKGEDSALDPRMDQVLGLLAQVPGDSADAAHAAELRGRIEAERARLRARQAELDATLKALRESPAGPFAAERAQDAAPAEPPAAPTEPVVGTTVEALSKEFGGCFAKAEPMYVQGVGLRDVWQRRDTADCTTRFPRFDTRVLVVEGSKVSSLALLQGRVEVLPDGGVSPVGGLPSGGADGGALRAPSSGEMK